jgi:hypothetical protein
VFGGEEVAALSDLADLPSTWPDGELPDGALAEQFERLRQQVRDAARRRSIWAAAGFAAGFAAIWGSVAVFAAIALSA